MTEIQKTKQYDLEERTLKFGKRMRSDSTYYNTKQVFGAIFKMYYNEFYNKSKNKRKRAFFFR